MKNLLNKNFFMIIFLGLIFSTFTFAQDKGSKNEDMNMKYHKKMDHTIKKDSAHHDISKKNSIVREGAIDLRSIDKNKDGKVYQDMMDFNVISDAPGKCPLCGMKLKEVSVDKAKTFLIKNKFKVKN